MDESLRDVKKVCVLINAVGAAALLAFLQAIWSSGGALSLKRGVLWGLVAFAAGVAVATLGYLAHHWALRKNQIKAGLFFQLAHVWIPSLAVVCFVLGLILPVLGGFDSLSGQARGAVTDSIRRR